MPTIPSQAVPEYVASCDPTQPEPPPPRPDMTLRMLASFSTRGLCPVDTLAEVAAMLLHNPRVPVYVVLEPGDMTRYAMRFQLAHAPLPLLSFTRLVGGSLQGDDMGAPVTIAVYHEAVRLEHVRVFDACNPHTGRVLTWWVASIVRALRALSMGLPV